jgi:hypothetical protein
LSTELDGLAEVFVAAPGRSPEQPAYFGRLNVRGRLANAHYAAIQTTGNWLQISEAVSLLKCSAGGIRIRGTQNLVEQPVRIVRCDGEGVADLQGIQRVPQSDARGEFGIPAGHDRQRAPTASSPVAVGNGQPTAFQAQAKVRLFAATGTRVSTRSRTREL